MKRLHVHVAVGDLAAGIKFYSTLFASEPTVRKPDYAKWMLDDPRVNFAISARGAAPGLNHLGVQVESAGELAEMNERLRKLETDVVEEMGTACCYARSDKYWATDPTGIAWETYRTLDSIPVFGASDAGTASAGGCCVPEPAAAKASSDCIPVMGKTPSGCC